MNDCICIYCLICLSITIGATISAVSFVFGAFVMWDILNRMPKYEPKDRGRKEEWDDK